MDINRIIAALPGIGGLQLDRMRRNAERLKSDGSPDQQAAAARLLCAIDAQGGSTAGHRERRSRTDRVAEAFRQMPPSETDLRVLLALLDNPGATSAALSRAIGWKGESWQQHFARMCEARAAWLCPPLPSERNAPVDVAALVAGFDPATGGYELTPEAVAGLARVGLSARDRIVA